MSEEVQSTDSVDSTEVSISETVDTSSFLDSIQDEYRNDPSVSKFSSVNDLAKEHVNLQSLLGRKGVIIPNEEDSSEVWNKYRKDIGIPEDSKSYTKDGFNSPEEVQWDSDFESNIAEAAHRLNLSDSQFTGLLNAYSEQVSLAQEKLSVNNSDSVEETQQNLRKEWGSAYDAKINMGIIALDQITDGDASSLADVILSDGSALGNNADFIKAMSQVGKTMQERGLINGETANTSAMSPDEAKQKLASIMSDPEKSNILFSQDFHPSKEELVKERERLLSFAYPEE